MRTTVDLPPATHLRIRELAESRGVSMSAVIADLTARGLAQLGEPVKLEADPVTGLPLVRVGRPLTPAEVADAVNDE